eukprot:CAMPEP_0198290640 /NCGR_PEP_ID=MMETSP1449-20131203/8430_1 /TAXON_ID=420275 /ORGANISM="Attheya septentrionalis, Strain CCMP2084" /LENGTH=807 /DNA_ID=CAMNT_0043989167 /DNA_START=219 /DNA_END=2642 /DNA_ORIENTATION=-
MATSRAILGHGENEDLSSLYKSHIVLLRSQNLAGMVRGDMDSTADDNSICISFQNEENDFPNLVAVTGETGSGKSLLVAKVAHLVTGGKADVTFVSNQSFPSDEQEKSKPTTVEMILKLSEPHLSAVKRELRILGLDPLLLDASNGNMETGMLSLKREMFLQPPSPSSSRGSEAPKPRLKSICSINGQIVSLKTLRLISASLLTIVDASVASTALSRPSSRMSILDTGVPREIISRAYRTRATYRQCRHHRERLEMELANRIFPTSLPDSIEDASDYELELMQHWVDELDSFECRVMAFRDSMTVSVDDDDDDDFAAGAATEYKETFRQLVSSSWSETSSDSDNTSQFYATLLEFRETVRSLEAQLSSARAACEALSSLASHESAITALQRARDCLFDATGGMGTSTDSADALELAGERSHDLLNAAEDALKVCVKSIENDSKGLIPTLERLRGDISVSTDDIDALISEWNTLARKHSISPYALPSCHSSLKSEIDGNVEARLLLPKAQKDEEAALVVFQDICLKLSTARQAVADELSQSVSHRLPSLGMEGSEFKVQLHACVRQCTESSAYFKDSTIGLDSVDFLLQHLGNAAEIEGENVRRPKQRGGKIETIASAGEKARILLAIETDLPGSVGASCGSFVQGSLEKTNPLCPDAWLQLEEGKNPDTCSFDEFPPPIAVLYDEIDSHVGGRAAVALAKLLSDQTRFLHVSNEDPGKIKSRGQVISITHSPSVAAIADRHIVIQKCRSQEEDGLMVVPVFVSTVDGSSRRRELARMASGDLASTEAEIFADALIRDGLLHREGKQL